MNLADENHGTLGAHLYLTPPGKSRPRYMHLQQNRPIRPWATEAKKDLHRKHHTHQAIQAKGTKSTIASSIYRQLKIPRSKEPSRFSSSTISSKKEIHRRRRKRTKPKRKLEAKKERHSDSYNSLFMPEILLKKTNISNSTPVHNAHEVSALSRNSSYVQIAEGSTSQMTQTSDILIANADFPSKELEYEHAWRLPSQKKQCEPFVIGESSGCNGEQIIASCSTMEPATSKKYKLLSSTAESESTNENVTVSAVREHRGTTDRLENILLTATHQIISIITNGLSIMVLLHNILGDGRTYQYDDISCRLEECRNSNVNSLERLKYLCSDVKFEAVSGSDLEEKIKSAESDENDQNTSTHVYLPIQNGSQFIGVLVVQVAEVDDALHLHHRAITDTLFKQYIYNMAISIDNCRYEEGFTENKGQASCKSSSYSTAEVSRSYKKVFDLQSQVDDLQIKLRTSAIHGAQSSSSLSKEEKQNMPHQHDNDRERNDTKPMSIDDLSGATLQPNKYDKPHDVDVDGNNIGAKDDVMSLHSSLRAYSRRIKNLHKVLEQEYEDIKQHKSYLHEKGLTLEQQSLTLEKIHELNNLTESDATLSPRNLEQEWQELDAQLVDVERQKRDLNLLRPYLKDLDDFDKNAATRYASSFGVNLHEESSSDRQLVTSFEFDASGFKPINHDVNLPRRDKLQTSRRKKKMKGRKGRKKIITKKRKKRRRGECSRPKAQ